MSILCPLTVDMRRAIGQRGVNDRLVGSTLRAWHRHIVHERHLTWRQEGTVEGMLRQMNGIDTVADSVARRKRDMAAWRQGVAAESRGVEARREGAATAAARASARQQMQRDLARWSESAGAVDGRAEKQPVNLLVRTDASPRLAGRLDRHAMGPH